MSVDIMGYIQMGKMKIVLLKWIEWYSNDTAWIYIQLNHIMIMESKMNEK